MSKDMSIKMLSDTIDLMADSSKGILAADESTSTIGKRLATINLENSLGLEVFLDVYVRINVRCSTAVISWLFLKFKSDFKIKT